MKKAHRSIYIFSFAALCALLAVTACETATGECPDGAVNYPEFGCISSGFADNNRPYNYYLTQMGTGAAEASNCGPTSTAMALRWYSEGQDVEVSTIRETITPGDTGWWYTDDIEAALTEWGTPYSITGMGETSLLQALDRGNLVLACLTMGAITRAPNPDSTHFNRFYDYDSGHFIIIKGYIGDGEWLIVHDPNNWQTDYYDNEHIEPYGENRYYRTSEVLNSMEMWWPYFFEIGVTGGKQGRDIPVGRSGP